ncbi:hypothetical protein [Rhodococcus sp. NPDC058521]|uniref:hypothetical protein n=1 Tax=Rhodococcus sp. NPDC058521 TaxID=3346536 RepID=UPI003653B779
MAKYCAAVIVFVALLIAFNLTYRPKSNGRLTVRDRVVRGETAPTISYSRRSPAMLRAVTGVFGLIFATAAYDSRPQPDPDAILPVPESDGYGTTAVYALVALYFWSCNLAFVFGRLQVGYVAFTSEGIYQRGWSFESFLPWRAVLGVHSAYREYPMTLIIAYNDSWERRYTATWPWRIDRLPTVSLIEIDHRKMGDDAVRIHDYVTAKVAERSGR